MPIAPSSWLGTAPVTAKQLNTDLYTYTPGNNHTPNGILFHANRPSYLAALVNGTAATQGSSSGGTFTQIKAVPTVFGFTVPTNWKNYFDNSVLFGPGADLPNTSSSGSFSAAVPGSSGGSGVAGGYYLMWGYPVFSSSSSAGGAGAAIFQNTSRLTAGAIQLASTGVDNCGYVMDIVGGVSSSTYSLGGFSASSGLSYNYVANGTDYSGECVRFYTTWCGVSSGGATVSSLPVPQPSYSTASVITSSFLNSGSGIAGPLSFLNNPPVLRAAYTNSTSISSSAVTVVSLSSTATGTQIDTYSGKSGNTYTVRQPGLYLCHGVVPWSSTSTSCNQLAGFQVNGTVNLWGPAYQNVSASAFAAAATWILDLNQNDTVSLIAYTTIGTSLALSSTYPCRLMMAWLGSLGTPSGTPTPPDTGFRWTAGASGTTLVSQFNSHLSNDLSFLMQRPYLLSYQSSSGTQSGFVANTWNTISMNQVKGVVHGSTGDNYNGWDAVNHKYVAPANGWYLVNSGYITTNGNTSPFSVVAGVNQSPAGTQSPDSYQRISSNSTASLHPGAEGCGLYYLRAGDSVQPQAMMQNGGGWGTQVILGGTVGSHFECVWISELQWPARQAAASLRAITAIFLGKSGVDTALITLLANAGTAGVIVILITIGWLVPKWAYSRLEEENRLLRKALETERQRAGEAVSSASMTNQLIGAIVDLAGEHHQSSELKTSKNQGKDKVVPRS